MIRNSFALFFVLLTATSFGQKKVLDAATFETWRSVRGLQLSNDGKWVFYALAPQDGDATVEVKATDGSKTYTIERGSNVQFTEDSHFVVASVVPKNEDVKKARRAKAKPEDMPKNGMSIINVATGERVDLDRIQNYTLATHDSGWIAYKPEPPNPAAKPEVKPDVKPEVKPEAGVKADVKKNVLKPDHKAGDALVLRNLATAKEERIESVVLTRWTKDGSALAYTVSTLDGAGDGVVLYDLKAGSKQTALTGAGHYPKLAISDKTKDVALVTDRDDYQAKKPLFAVYLFKPGAKAASLVANEKTEGLAKSFVPSDQGGLQFSDKGTRLTFGTAPRAGEDKKDDTPDDEKVSVDIWNWQDPQMMSQQILSVATERNRTYDAAYTLATGKVTQLESVSFPNSIISEKGDGPWALLTSIVPYERENSWQEDKTDYALLNLSNGQTTNLATAFNGRLQLAPTGKYAVGFDQQKQELFSIKLGSDKRIVLNKGLPPIWEEEIDIPTSSPSYGYGGFTKDDRVLVYDRYDIWLLSLDGGSPGINLTGGMGRRAKTMLRFLRLDPEQDFVDLAAPAMLAAFGEESKQSGYYRLQNGKLETLLFEPKAFSASVQGSPMPTLVKAKHAERYAFQKMDVAEYANAWIADADLKNPRQITEANPQQKDYNWVTSELVNWISNDGVPLKGVLYKPENFDNAKKYPMITYFYERSSDTLHQYFSPAPSASTINISMYCSNGYLVFVPDIPYKVGYPGESAVSAILPGVQSLLTRGYVDAKHLGIQGQSWGGYQVGYLVTETNLFAAACAGAPVSDMVSAYGGIRWESGVSREGQYEHGQSRIGGSLWENPLRFIENSPIFFADKIKTPLLIMSNDKDGAVPWYQGIEYFSALRRLNKPAWLVVYNEEAHNLVQRKNRKDWSIRMQQFFDHYLKGAPMPVWMAMGVPATLKGKSYGFELLPPPK